MRSEYGTRTLVTSAFGLSVFENHQTVLTASFARSLRLFTHSMGDGSLAGLYQKNSRSLVTSAFGLSVFENHQTVLTASFARSLRLFTHSMGDGSLAGLYQKNS